MYMKELSLPNKVVILEALLDRLSDQHPKIAIIQNDLSKILTVYKGERAISYYLDYLSERGYCLFHGLRLPRGRHFFQIDYLVLSTRSAIILECKNFYGTLFFDNSFKQLIRTTEEREEGFLDPISQAKWHQQQLRNLFNSYHFSLPIDYLVVISNPSTIIKTHPHNKQALNKVVHSHTLLEKIDEMEKQFPNEKIDKKGLRKLCKILLKGHTPETFNAMERYDIGREEILTGVRCPSCRRLPMIRAQRTWLCPSCGCKSKNAHVSAVNDYFLLISSSISNREFRNFAHLQSEDAAKRLLRGMNLPSTGANKGKIYYKPEVFLR